ncbi:major facilitator superfamily domain-containing protein [Mycena rebaudengoi]|nr:major facilitator superfamily domain-containing protein [Mycena rebaudengoi]
MVGSGSGKEVAPPTNSAPASVHARAPLEEYERGGDDRPPFILTYTEVKLLGIAVVGFFLDAYDLFVINPVSTMLQYRLYGGHALPAGLQGFLKAGANIGSVIGHSLLVRYLADALGRKAIYGKELMLIIFATIMCLTTPTGSLSPDNSLIYLTIWASSSVSALAEGWGSFVGSLATIVVLAAYKGVMDGKGETSKTDGGPLAYRRPAFGTLYQRLTLPESTRFIASQEKTQDVTDIDKKEEKSATNSAVETEEVEEVLKKKAHFREFITYFSEWRHAKLLIGTSLSWFFLDIAFYGINLNQNVVLQQIGYGGKTGTPWEKLFNISTGNMIITALGFVPGCYVSILTIEKLGRKWIQLQGFLLEALFLAILAGKFHTLSKTGFIVCFTLLQFFFNFGANTTTYCYLVEVFPTRFRASAHDMSAAAGKAGTIISALVFNKLSQDIGIDKVLWIFVGCSIAGACTTLLLPEVRGRDPDLVLAQEIEAARAANKN